MVKNNDNVISYANIVYYTALSKIPLGCLLYLHKLVRWSNIFYLNGKSNVRNIERPPPQLFPHHFQVPNVARNLYNQIRI